MTVPRKRRKPPGATTRGGWGHTHQRRRAAIAPLVNAAKTTCARCLEPIRPGDEWHLDHNDARDGYLGVSHSYCNLAAAAHKSNDSRRHPTEAQRPYRWSQRWCEDPPAGTVVFNGGNPIEVFNGDAWITVERDDLASVLLEYGVAL
jgi:hypothetical protein